MTRPDPAKLWTLRVDEEGEPSFTGKFLARPPVATKFLGTTTYPPGLDASNYDRQKELDQQLFDRSTLIASQEENARDLIGRGHKRGMTYEFDPVATSRLGAAANLFWKPKNVPSLWMHPYGLTDQMALPETRGGTLAHENEHVSQNGLNFFPRGKHTLASAIRCVRAQEAAAVAAGALVAMRFMVDRPGDHPQRWKPKDYGSAFDTSPLCLQAAVKDALPDMRRGDSATAGRKIFQSFYQDEHELAYYDLMTIKLYDKMLKNGLAENDPQYLSGFMKTQAFSQKSIVDTLRLGNRKYLSGLTINLDDREPAGLTNRPDVVEAYKQLDSNLHALRRRGYTPNSSIPSRPDSISPRQDLANLLAKSEAGNSVKITENVIS